MMPARQADLEFERRKVASLTGELLTVYEELSLLHSLGSQISRLMDEDQIAAAALREAMEILRTDCGWVVTWDGENSRVPAGCRVGIDDQTAGDVNQAVLEPLRSRGKIQTLTHSLRDEWNIAAADAPDRFLACSLVSGGGSQGYLCLGRRKQGRMFTSVDQKLSYAVASLTGMTLENVRLQRSELDKQRMDRELELARQIQRSLLPRDFSCSKFVQASGRSLPCQEVGGDYFDLMAVDDDHCLLVIADVSGKGPGAALKAAMLQGIIHAASRYSTELPYLTSTAHACVRERTTDNSFITAFVAVLDSTGILQFSNCGHNPPLWVKTSGEIRELTEGGPPLGILPDLSFGTGCVQLNPGDLLFLYTDGVTDSDNAGGDSFGPERMLKCAGNQVGRLPAEVEENLISDVTEFCNGHRQSDDLTLLVLRFAGLKTAGH